MEVTDVVPGRTYRDTRTEWVGVAQPHDKLAAKARQVDDDGNVTETVKVHRLADGRRVRSVGPMPGDDSVWVVAPVTLDADGEVSTVGAPETIDRELTNTIYPRVWLQAPGPKGVDERRPSYPADLEEVPDEEVAMNDEGVA